MNRRSFLKMFANLPLVLPFVDKVELSPPQTVETITRWDGLGNSWETQDGKVWTQVSFAPNTTMNLSVWDGKAWQDLTSPPLD